MKLKWVWFRLVWNLQTNKFKKELACFCMVCNQGVDMTYDFASEFKKAQQMEDD